ncbi:MAG TPA: hypothetical protein VFU47_03960 [Armatimonadota bacterium]|nr:hypothetical protein [Armatimonadota bacterium]
MLLMTDDRQEILETLARTPGHTIAIHRLTAGRWGLGGEHGPELPGAAFIALERDGLIRFTDRASIATRKAVIAATSAGLAAIA